MIRLKQNSIGEAFSATIGVQNTLFGLELLVRDSMLLATEGSRGSAAAFAAAVGPSGQIYVENDVFDNLFHYFPLRMVH
jgi:hypothetical protein